MNLMLGAAVCVALPGDVVGPACVAAWVAEGRAAADCDIAAGVPRWLRYGCTSGADHDALFATIIRDRYGVVSESVALTPHWTEAWTKAEGYNARIVEHLDARYGPGAIDRAWQDADPDRVFRWRAKVVLLVAGAAAVGLWVLAWWRVGRRGLS